MIRLSQVIQWLNPQRKPRDCAHDFKLTHVHAKTLEPHSRQCQKCGLTQHAETIWVDGPAPLRF